MMEAGVRFQERFTSGADGMWTAWMDADVQTDTGDRQQGSLPFVAGEDVQKGQQVWGGEAGLISRVPVLQH